MNPRSIFPAIVLCGFAACSSPAAVLYVDLNSANPTQPYASWSTAATNIQDAVDASSDGDLILVTDGVYQTGGRAVYGSLTNRVVINKAVTVRSVNGPEATVIDGGGALRCLYLSNTVSMDGFTLTNGTASDSGGGVFSESTNSILTNCIVTGGTAVDGGGAFQATLNNCILSANSAGTGGGAEGCILNHCTLDGNYAGYGGGMGGGVDTCTLNDCILTNNTGDGYGGGGASSSLLNRCTLSGNLAGSQGGGALDCTLNDCVISVNNALEGGGGLSGGSATNCAISGNSSSGASYSTLDNCLVSGNSGTGAYYCTLNNCTLTGNSGFQGGGAAGCTLTNCSLGGNTAYYSGGADSSTLVDCTLTGNSGFYGGGAGGGSTLNNCVLSNNPAGLNGGGAEGCTLNNCTLTGNTALNGGGADSSALNNCALAGNAALYHGGAAENCTLNNCTLVFNSVTVSGGGADSSVMNNCIVYFNSASGGANYSDGTLNFCCTTPLPGGGTNNITGDPQLADTAHVSAASPCIGAGSTNYSTGVDIDGDPWLNPPSIGCDEYHAGVASGSLSVAIQVDYTNVAPGIAANFGGLVYGKTADSYWDFGDGTMVSNQLSVSHSWTTAGSYPVVLTAYNDSNPGGISATVMVSVTTQQVYYVDAACTNPVAPFLTWSTAATNIQDAVDEAVPGGTVLVTDGVYQSGGRVVYGSPTNLVVVTKPITVQSVNGPSVTVIQGYQDTNTPAGNAAVRCVYLAGSVTLAGFTLAGGGTLIDQYENLDDHFYSGGGVYCESAAAVVSNCVISGCSASDTGGGAVGGTLNNCVLTNCSSFVGGGAGGDTLNNCVLAGNSAGYGGGIYNSTANGCLFVNNFANGSGDTGGGAYYCMLTNCSLADNSAPYSGGADSSTLVNCTLTGNSASYGGGAGSSTLDNCALVGNSASQNGGGAENCTLNNCTLSGNSAATGGGADSSALDNCIVYFNSAPGGANYSGGTLNFCCTTPLPGSGADNITGNPQLTDSAHISSNSPCIGAGSAQYSTGMDIDGQAWLNPPSIGCDEFYAGAVTGPLDVVIQADYTNVAVGFTVNFYGQIIGHASYSVWDFGDGIVASNQLAVSHAWASPGHYAVVFTAFNDDFPEGINSTCVVQVVAGNYFVSLAGTNPVAPYLSWDTAATNIQDAVDAAFAGSTVLVSNGVYQTGMESVDGSTTNRVTVIKPLTLHSVNGSALTAIDGGGALRCVYLARGTQLAGFTLTNGYSAGEGGGVFCEAAGIVVSNCLLTGNSASDSGGGASGGWFFNCAFISNSAANYGGGADQCVLNNCGVLSNSASYGGGANNSTITGTTISGNSAYWEGGGAESSSLNDCVISANASTATVGSSGGGADNCTLTNCLLAGNSVSYYGGGAQGCTLDGCTLNGNAAGDYGGAVYSTLNNCLVTNNSGYYGGGLGHGNATNCLITGNFAPGGGGGAEENLLVNCVVVGNSAYQFGYGGGGALLSTLVNCTVVGNSGADPCGIAACAVFNSVVQDNFDGGGALANYGDYLGIYGYSFNNSCTTPLPPGLWNITNDPALVNPAGGDFHLQTNSPCINSGDNTCVTAATDLDGNPRIVGGTVDIGAYEYQTPASIISYAWLQQYGLPTDGSADYADTDGTGMNNLQKWIAGLNPTDPASVLAMLVPVAATNSPGMTVSWQSVEGVNYFIQGSGDLSAQPPFTTIQSNIVGQAGTTSYTDTTATNAGPYFYRVGVQ